MLKNFSTKKKLSVGNCYTSPLKIPQKKKQNERILQKNCIKWFDFFYKNYSKLLFSIPNGGKRNAFEGKNLKSEGVRAGVPDLFLAIPKNSYSGLFIELKVKNNNLSKNQEEYCELLKKSGYKVVIVRNFEEFCNVIKEYLNE